MYITLSEVYKIEKKNYKFCNALSIFSPNKQMFFFFHNLLLTYSNLFSSGVFLNKHIKHFKFLKKSHKIINPLLLIFRYHYTDDLDYLYYLEIKNFFKKHYMFLKKFFLYIKTKLCYIILVKSWNFVAKPKKRIKKKIYKKVSKVVW